MYIIRILDKEEFAKSGLEKFMESLNVAWGWFDKYGDIVVDDETLIAKILNEFMYSDFDKFEVRDMHGGDVLVYLPNTKHPTISIRYRDSKAKDVGEMMFYKSKLDEYEKRLKAISSLANVRRRGIPTKMYLRINIYVKSSHDVVINVQKHPLLLQENHPDFDSEGYHVGRATNLSELSQLLETARTMVL